jgi:hypothetical protein
MLPSLSEEFDHYCNNKPPVLFDGICFDLFRRIVLSSPLLIKREVPPKTYSAIFSAEPFATFHREFDFSVRCSAFLYPTAGMRV